MEGKKPRPEGILPKGHWILPEERERILSFKRQHPTVGGVRLAYMMLDQGVAAVSPSTVFRVLREAGLSSQWTLPEGRKASRQGFYQPKSPHEQWHTDIAYINLRGTHYFFISVLCSVSRKWTGNLGMMDRVSPSWWTLILAMMDTPSVPRKSFPCF